MRGGLNWRSVVQMLVMRECCSVFMMRGIIIAEHEIASRVHEMKTIFGVRVVNDDIFHELETIAAKKLNGAADHPLSTIELEKFNSMRKNAR